MSAPRPSEADVEALAEQVWNAMPAHHVGWRGLKGDERAFYLGIAERLHPWLAARDAEHEREVADLCEQVAFLETELDAAPAHAALAEGESCDVCTHLESEQVQRWMAEDEDRAEAAERALADLRGEIKALADKWERHARMFVAEQDRGTREDWQHVATTLRALLPRDDAAGAGGAP